MNLADRVPDVTAAHLPDAAYGAFTEWVTSRGLSLYPAQDEAVMELVQGNNVILATPTGSGKSMVAVAAHFVALAKGQRSYYTAPIKALVSEKFFDLIGIFGANNVGMVTGDSAVNPDAPIICCTAEIVANLALRHGADSDVGVVIMDEFHFYADRQRGWAWQTPLITLPDTQFLLLSATLGPTDFFEDDLTERTGRKTVTVAGAERPIPLYYHYGTEQVQETLEELVQTHRAPVYVVHFSQLEAIERAQSLLSLNLCTRQEKDRIGELIGGFRFSAGFGKTLNRLVRQGVGVHHAGMLPKYRRLVEQLAQAGLLKVICGTDTLGVGINVPIRTVLITALSKYDGERTRHLGAREFHQIAGRAGRAGYDTAGDVVVQAPEHDIENAKAMTKARGKFGDDQKKLRQVKKKSAPQGFVSWTEKTFDRLVNADPEPLNSSFKVTNSMILNLLAREGDTFGAARALLTENHEPPVRQRAHIIRALGILRELMATGVIERTSTPDRYGNHLRLTVTLQENFALNQPLSGFAIAALEMFQPEDDGYALDVISVIEATLEHPRQVITAQIKKAKGEAIAAMKADGVEYNERMARLDLITEPRPLEEQLDAAFEQYRKGAGWLADLELKPKSVVRDMFERAMDFGDYVQYYGLARSEGVLLRYLTDAYKALRQTVPQEGRTDTLQDVVAWLGEIIEQTDSSLLDEWEALSAGKVPGDDGHEIPQPPSRLTDHERAFKVMVRNQLFRRVKLFGREDDRALGELDGEDGFDADAWADLLDDYFAEHEDLNDGPGGRSPALVSITPGKDADGKRIWRCRQAFADPAGDHDWGFDAVVDLDASDEAGEAVVHVTRLGRLDG